VIAEAWLCELIRSRRRRAGSCRRSLQIRRIRIRRVIGSWPAARRVLPTETAPLRRLAPIEHAPLPAKSCELRCTAIYFGAAALDLIRYASSPDLRCPFMGLHGAGPARRMPPMRRAIATKALIRHVTNHGATQRLIISRSQRPRMHSSDSCPECDPLAMSCSKLREFGDLAVAKRVHRAAVHIQLTAVRFVVAYGGGCLPTQRVPGQEVAISLCHM
jgi:hypothetical protein